MAKNRPRVFISAAASDASIVRELTDHLAAAGVEVWSAATDVLPGSNFSAEIGSALNRADAVVVLISPASMKSSWVRHEIQFALGTERFEGRLIPVLVKDTPSDSIPWVLQHLAWPERGPLDKVAEGIVKALRGPKRREVRAAAR